MKRCDCEVRNIEGQINRTQLAKLSADLRAVAIKSRLELLLLLKDGPHCVCDLAEHTKMSQSLVSHHLSDLSDSGYIKNRREGKFIDYFLTDKGSKVIKALDLIIK